MTVTRYSPLWLQSGSYPAAWDRQLIGTMWPTPASKGLAVSVASGMSLNIASGAIAVPSQNNTGSSLCVSDAVEQVTLAAAPGSGTNRIDLVIAQPRGTDLDGGSNNDFVFTTVTGAPAATPVAPAVPPGAVALAQVYVTGGSVSIVAGNITDTRPFGLGPSGQWDPLPAGAALRSLTDANGEVWVAKGGVYGGAWKRARDVLHSQVYRSAAFTLTNGAAAGIPCDTVISDPYGIYNTTNGQATVLIPGVWHYHWHLSAATSNTGQGVMPEIRNQGNSPIAFSSYGLGLAAVAQTAGGCDVTKLMTGVAPLNFVTSIGSSYGANLGISVGPQYTYFNADYLGTG